MDPAAWSSYYSRLNASNNSGGVNASADLTQCYSANSLILAQLRDVEALSVQPVPSYHNMGLPPSLVHAATQGKLPQQHYQQLQQQALANLGNVVTNSAGAFGSNGLQNGNAFLSASNAIQMQSPWKAAANNVATSRTSSSTSSSSSFNSSHVDSSGFHEAHLVAEGNVQLPNVMRQAVELKTSQPIFPGQPPPLSRLEKREPPPRQSSQARTASSFTAQQPQTTAAFRDYASVMQQQKVPRQSPTQQPIPSPQHYFEATNNSSPQHVANASAFYQANSPLHQQQLLAQQQHLEQQRLQEQQRQRQQQEQQRQRQQQEQQRRQQQEEQRRQQEEQRRQQEEQRRQQEEHQRRQQQEQQRRQQEQQRQQQQQQHSFLTQMSQQARSSGSKSRSKKSAKETQEQYSGQTKGAHQQRPSQSVGQLGFHEAGVFSPHQDVGLARLGALGTLTDVPEGDLLQSMQSTLSYEELESFGANSNSPLKAAAKSIERATWLNKASDLLDLSGSETTRNENSMDMLHNTSQQQVQQGAMASNSGHGGGGEQQGLIPQFVMNPWDPTQKPVLTLAAPLSAMQAYQMQMQMQPQQSKPNEEPQQPEEEEKKFKVICLSPDEELGFLLDLPPLCNVGLTPSSIGISSKGSRDTPFFAIFKKFLKGELPAAPPPLEPKQEDPEPANTPLPGKKAYVPPYTPKAINNRTVSTSSVNSSSTGSSFSRAPREDIEKKEPKVTTNVHKPILQHKRPRRTSEDMTEDERIARSLMELPKREVSRRKAKERRRTTQANDDDEPEVIGIDLSDSDDDATWTPFKETNSAPTTALGAVSTVVKKPRRVDATKLIKQGEPFHKGDFMILRTDIDKEGAPLWRLESRTTLQRFNFVDTSEYEGAKLFAAYNRHSRNKYVSVSVKFLRSERSNTHVQIVEMATEKNEQSGHGDSTETSLRKRSFNETSQFLEAFEVYVQALFSECLDTNFLQGVFQDSDEYFVSNLEKVDSVTLLRKDKVMTGTTWPSPFLTSLGTWPNLNDLGGSAVQDTTCAGCEKEKASTLIQLVGQPYDPSTLHSTQPSEEAVSNRNFSLCSKCIRLATLYHRLHHAKHSLFTACSDLVSQRLKNGDNNDYEKLLKELLADEKWLEQQFGKMQELWADADTFVR